MGLSMFLRCLLISAVISGVGPILTMTIVVPSDQDLIDISGITAEELEGATPEELELIMKEKAGSRRISGILERWSYVASHPQLVRFYLQAAGGIFILMLPATLLASVWSVRARRQHLGKKGGT